MVMSVGSEDVVLFKVASSLSELLIHDTSYLRHRAIEKHRPSVLGERRGLCSLTHHLGRHAITSSGTNDPNTRIGRPLTILR